MNCIKAYYSIINKAKLRGFDKKKLEGYFEEHHIIPSCYFRSRRIASYKENLVLLTGEEHVICHHLLWRNDITNNKLFMAYHKMVYQHREYQDREIRLTAKQYEILKVVNSNRMRNRFISPDTIHKMKAADRSGEKNSFFGRRHSEETKTKMKLAHMNRPLPLEAKRLGLMKTNRKYKPHTEETKLKMKIAQQRRRAFESHRAYL